MFQRFPHCSELQKYGRRWSWQGRYARGFVRRKRIRIWTMTGIFKFEILPRLVNKNPHPRVGHHFWGRRFKIKEKIRVGCGCQNFRKVTNLILLTFENPINFAISEEPMEEDSMMTNEEAEDGDAVDDEQDNEESHGAGGEQNRTIRHLFECLCAIWRRKLHRLATNLSSLFDTHFLHSDSVCVQKTDVECKKLQEMKCRLLQKTTLHLRCGLKNWNEFRDGCGSKNLNLEKSDEMQFCDFWKQVDNSNWAASTSEKKKGGKRGRKGKKAKKSGPAIPDTTTTNSADMAAAIGISDIGFKYSEDDYSNITSLKVGRMLVYA